MTVLQISTHSRCAGEGHAQIKVIMQGGPTDIYSVTVDDLREALDERNRETIAIGIFKLAMLGLTNAQAKAKFDAGFTVTI